MIVELTVLSLLELVRQSLAFLLLVEVCRDGVCFALSERIELFYRFVAGLRITRRNVNSGAVGHKSLRDHATYALRTTGDKHHLALVIVN